MKNTPKKVAIITGAGIGIGYEIAKQLALEGVHRLSNWVSGYRYQVLGFTPDTRYL